jgi:anion-transporting  ArsA/GET3 family ATPase
VRILLFTGKGGVGKSTVAAGTAALAAASGLRTLVLSTDAAHSLADAFGTPVGAEPTEVADRLFVQQVDAQLRFEQSWAEIPNASARLWAASVDSTRVRWPARAARVAVPAATVDLPTPPLLVNSRIRTVVRATRRAS